MPPASIRASPPPRRTRRFRLAVLHLIVDDRYRHRFFGLVRREGQRTGGCRLYLIHSYPVRADMPIHISYCPMYGYYMSPSSGRHDPKRSHPWDRGPVRQDGGDVARSRAATEERSSRPTPCPEAGTQPSPDVTGENRQSDPDRGWVRAAATARHFGFGRSPPAHMRQRVPSGRASSDEAYRGPASPTRLPPHQERNRALRLLHPGVVHP